MMRHLRKEKRLKQKGNDHSSGAEGEGRSRCGGAWEERALVGPVPFEVFYAPSKQLESNIDVETQFKKMFVAECPLLAVAGLDLDLQVFEILNHLLMAHALSGTSFIVAPSAICQRFHGASAAKPNSKPFRLPCQ